MKRLLAITAITAGLLTLGAGAASADDINLNCDVGGILDVGASINLTTGFFDDPVNVECPSAG